MGINKIQIPDFKLFDWNQRKNIYLIFNLAMENKKKYKEAEYNLLKIMHNLLPEEYCVIKMKYIQNLLIFVSAFNFETGSAQTSLPPARTGNFYVSIYNADSVAVYDSTGEYLHRLLLK
jgi:hypothetical protein